MMSGMDGKIKSQKSRIVVNVENNRIDFRISFAEMFDKFVLQPFCEELREHLKCVLYAYIINKSKGR